MVTKYSAITSLSMYHAQAQFLWKGNWEFLRWDTDALEVRLSDREDPWGYIDRIYTLEEFQHFINQFQRPAPQEAKWEN
jgi:cyclopropane fatty-acyl-phospholipid synthase-like methyltransferase